MKENYSYYFAYGMNTNEEQMKFRCPTAVPLGVATLPKHRFDFKTHATITVDQSDSVDGVLWLITDIDEDSLDILEGYPRYYLKKAVDVEFQGQIIPAMTYYIPGTTPVYPPHDSYYHMVVKGYEKFGVSTRQLVKAKNHAESRYNKKFYRDLVDYKGNLL